MTAFSFRNPGRLRLGCLFAFLLGLSVFVQGQQPSGSIHTFTGPNGSTVEAEVLDLVDGKVVIRRLSDGQRFEMPANRLAPQDVDFMRAWLAAREASKHPLDWKRVKIHLPESADEVEAPGIPAAFRRTDAHTWEAELPEGAWVLVKLWREGGGDFAPQFLLPYGGERDWFLTFADNRLGLALDPGGEVREVGVAVRAEDDEAALRSMKSGFPGEGIALYAGFFDAADVTALRGAIITSLVVGKLPDYSVAKEGKVRALRITDTIADPVGLGDCDALEYFEVPDSGEFPMDTLGGLENLRTLIGDGEVNLEAIAAKDAPFPALRHLSLAACEIEGAAALPAFLEKLPKLQSLALPDFVEMDVTGIARCPELTVIELGNDCLDHGAQGISALGALTIALLNPHYTAAEVAALAEKGTFAKIRKLGISQAFDFGKAPSLVELHLEGDQAGFPLSGLTSLPELPALVLEFPTDADLSGLSQAGPDLLGLKSLVLRSPKVIDVAPLSNLPALEHLVVRDQLVTFEEKLTRIDLTGCANLKSLELTRLQNLAELDLGSVTLSALILRSCTDLATVNSTAADSLEELVIDNARSLKGIEALTGEAGLTVKRVSP